MMNLHDLFNEIDQRPTSEKWQIVRRLLGTLEQDSSVKADNWNQALLDTYGILADDPIERGDQGEYEERDPFE